jgi:hypothetical protein
LAPRLTDAGPFSGPRLGGKTDQHHLHHRVVETPAAQWAYAVEILLSRFYDIKAIRIKLQASVNCGRLGIGILDKSGRSFLRESFIGPEDNRRQSMV